MESQKMEFLAIGDYLVNVNEIGSIGIEDKQGAWVLVIKSKVAMSDSRTNTNLASIIYKSKNECQSAMSKVIDALSGHVIHKI